MVGADAVSADISGGGNLCSIQTSHLAHSLRITLCDIGCMVFIAWANSGKYMAIRESDSEPFPLMGLPLQRCIHHHVVWSITYGIGFSPMFSHEAVYLQEEG